VRIALLALVVACSPLPAKPVHGRHRVTVKIFAEGEVGGRIESSPEGLFCENEPDDDEAHTVECAADFTPGPITLNFSRSAEFTIKRGATSESCNRGRASSSCRLGVASAVLIEVMPIETSSRRRRRDD